MGYLFFEIQNVCHVILFCLMDHQPYTENAYRQVLGYSITNNTILDSLNFPALLL